MGRIAKAISGAGMLIASVILFGDLFESLNNLEKGALDGYENLLYFVSKYPVVTAIFFAGVVLAVIGVILCLNAAMSASAQEMIEEEEAEDAKEAHQKASKKAAS